MFFLIHYPIFSNLWMCNCHKLHETRRWFFWIQEMCSDTTRFRIQSISGAGSCGYNSNRVHQKRLQRYRAQSTRDINRGTKITSGRTIKRIYQRGLAFLRNWFNCCRCRRNLLLRSEFPSNFLYGCYSRRSTYEWLSCFNITQNARC